MGTNSLNEFLDLLEVIETSFKILDKTESFHRRYLDYQFNISNATLRIAVERYARGVLKYQGRTSKLMEKFDKEFNSVIVKYKIRYDTTNHNTESPLNINRYIRNQFLHNNPNKPVKKLSTSKNTIEILQQKVFFNFVEKPTLSDDIFVELKYSDSVNVTGLYLEYLINSVREIIENIDRTF